MQTQSLLPGVPIIESPFFSDIAASDYFAAHEKKIAADLNKFGFAILHGDERILRAGTTRWSQVTHDFFEGCDYYTPMHSNVFGGEIKLRTPVDIATGLPLERPEVALKSTPKAKPKPWFEKLFGWNRTKKAN